METLKEQIRNACEVARASGNVTSVSISIDILPGEYYEDVIARICHDITADTEEEISQEDFTGISTDEIRYGE